MGHAHHFLSRLDRVSYDEVELSLGLYNNAPLVKHILARSGLPPSAERVAISLDDEREGPFLIVTREGRFVTCLGRGMHHEHPVVRRWQLDLLAQRHEELAACMRPAERIPVGERALGRLLDQILGYGNELSREAFLDLAPLQPLMFPHYLKCLHDVHAWLVQQRHELRHLDRPRPCDHDRLERHWKHLWGMKHLCALLGVGDPVGYFRKCPRELLEPVVTSLTYYTGEHVAHCLSALGAWATARFEGAFLPIAGATFERTPYVCVMRQSSLELAAIAGAHPHHRDAILDALRGRQARTEKVERGLCQDAERARAAERVLAAFERTDDLDVRAALWGAKRFFAFEPAVAERHGWRSIYDVPLDVAMPYAVDTSSDWLTDPGARRELYDIMPSVARYRPEDFYTPARWLPEVRMRWDTDFSIGYLTALRGAYQKREPFVAQKVPGRNERCNCGSGEKYKKCCAVVKAPKPTAVAAVKVASPTLADGIWPRIAETTTEQPACDVNAEAANDDATRLDTTGVAANDRTDEAVSAVA